MAKQPPRGLRNNNPGNIVKGSTKWRGEVDGTDARFCTFSTMPYGYRALMLLLQNYQRLHGLRTIRQLISRWAPSSENNTSSYIRRVSRLTGYGTDDVLCLQEKSVATNLAAAISEVENGQSANRDDIDRGWYLLKL